ncbi:MAG TPA: hypothetical protein VEV41_26230 [Terriglobales bacterium]|nr:hypothetical protein [Terriglobales bacterium]
MHRAKQVWQWMRSSAAKMGQQTGSLMTKVASLPKKAKSRQADDLIPPLAVLMGAAAFGLWRQSITAAIFALVGLSLLAGIYNNTERMLAALRRSEAEPQFGEDARALAEPTTADSGALSQAIGCLKPWLANEVPLTEENAKECCAVLLDSVAAKARPATRTISG